MTIRRATLADADALVVFLVDLTTESTYTGGRVANAAHLSAELDRLLPLETSGFFVAVDAEDDILGLLAWLLYEDLISGETCAAQACWYMDPAHRDGTGRALLAAAEAWADTKGAMRWQMLSPDAKFDTYYKRRGYVQTERIFERRLTTCPS